MNLNKRIKVDWDKWQDEDRDKDIREDFDPEKLIEIMKKNGDWDDEEDGPEDLEDQFAQESGSNSDE